MKRKSQNIIIVLGIAVAILVGIFSLGSEKTYTMHNVGVQLKTTSDTPAERTEFIHRIQGAAFSFTKQH
jgi:hypothetical protein